MDAKADNETWLIEEAGDAIIEKKAEEGIGALSPLERLIYCLWVADYGMRNAGDLVAASELYPSFQDEGRLIARELGLSRTEAAFGLTQGELERRYFELFERMCDELRGGWA